MEPKLDANIENFKVIEYFSMKKTPCIHNAIINIIILHDSKEDSII